MSQPKGFKVKNWLEIVGQTTLQILGLLDANGQVAYDTDKDKLVAKTNNVNDPIVQEARAAVLTNKSIDADTNTITNIENADIKAGAAIDASKIADGSVSNTEFQYLDGLNANIQDQLDGQISSDLNEHNILVGDSSNKSAPVDTNVSGDILADSVNGLTYKAGSIDDADISAAAAISRAKVAVGSVNQVLINDGSGLLSSEARLALSRGGSAIDNSQTNDAITTGTAAQLNAVTGHVRLTDASLVSLAMIPAASAGGVKFSLYNDTGNSVTILNNSGATPANRIFSGTGNNLNFADGSSLSLVYDSGESRWLIVGGTGSGGGSWISYATENIAASGTISNSTLVGLQVRRVQGNAAPVTAASAPFGVSGGWSDGAVIRLVGQSADNSVTILNNDIAKGVILNGNITLGYQDQIELQFDSSLDRWIEVSRSN